MKNLKFYSFVIALSLLTSAFLFSKNIFAGSGLKPEPTSNAGVQFAKLNPPKNLPKTLNITGAVAFIDGSNLYVKEGKTGKVVKILVDEYSTEIKVGDKKVSISDIKQNSKVSVETAYSKDTGHKAVSVNQDIKTVKFFIDKMTCSGCIARIEGQLNNLKGVVSSKVDFTNKTGEVTYEPTTVEFSAIKNAVESLGYAVRGFENKEGLMINQADAASLQNPTPAVAQRQNLQSARTNSASSPNQQSPINSTSAVTPKKCGCGCGGK